PLPVVDPQPHIQLVRVPHVAGEAAVTVMGQLTGADPSVNGADGGGEPASRVGRELGHDLLAELLSPRGQPRLVLPRVTVEPDNLPTVHGGADGLVDLDLGHL